MKNFSKFIFFFLTKKKALLLLPVLLITMMLMLGCSDQAPTTDDNNDDSAIENVENYYEFSVIQARYVDKEALVMENGSGYLENEYNFEGAFYSTEDVDNYFASHSIRKSDQFRLWGESLTDDYFAEKFVIFKSALNYGMENVNYDVSYCEYGADNVLITVKVIPSSSTSLNTKWDGMRYCIFEANKEKRGDKNHQIQYLNAYRSHTKESFEPTASSDEIGDVAFAYSECGVGAFKLLPLQIRVIKITSYEDLISLANNCKRTGNTSEKWLKKYAPKYTETYFASGNGLCVVLTGKNWFTRIIDDSNSPSADPTASYEVTIENGMMHISAIFNDHLMNCGHQTNGQGLLFFEMSSNTLNSVHEIEVDLIRYHETLAEEYQPSNRNST